jgi:hypothetical protein
MIDLINRSLPPESKGVIAATSQLLALLRVKVTYTSVRDTLLSHPAYLSLLSITDCLQSLNVETRAIRVDTGQLDELPRPFIAYLAKGRNRFITITNIENDSVEYLDGQSRKKNFSRVDFLYAWEGVALLASAADNSGEPDFYHKKIAERRRNMGLPVGLLLFLTGGILHFFAGGQVFKGNDTIYFASLLLSKFLGVIVTSLLLWYEYDGNQALLKQICVIGKKANCNAILHSGASKLPGGISWSEVGFVYFTGGYVALTAAGTSALPWLYYLNLLALPYICFSLYYQGMVARQWCILCLLVQLLLSLEFLSSLITHHGIALQWHAFMEQSNRALLPVAASFVAIAYGWMLAKPYIYEERHGRGYRHQLSRFKRNAEVFNAMLKEQPVLQPGTEGMGITMGNPTAKNTLLKICNPYCGPCAKAHPKIESLVGNNPDWKVRIIFAVNGQDGDLRSITAAHLMAIAGQRQPEPDGPLREKAIHEWYEEGGRAVLLPEARYEAFAAKYPVNGQLDLQTKKVREMAEWCEKAGITHTPTIYVNGYLLPEQYDIKDLEYL